MRALRGADLDIGRGEFVAVMGPSGCGKSTLLNIVAGLDVPDEGEVVVAGESLVGKTESELADHAPPAHRHRVPVLQPARRHDGARERVMPALIAGTQAQGGRDTRPRPARPARHRRQGQAVAGSAVGWAAPAAGHRPRAGQRADAAAGRRADRRARLGRAARRCSSCSPACTAAGRRSCWSPTTSRSPTPPNASCACGTAAWSTTVAALTTRGLLIVTATSTDVAAVRDVPVATVGGAASLLARRCPRAASPSPSRRSRWRSPATSHPALVVVSCLACAWAIAGVAVTTRQRCPAAVDHPSDRVRRRRWAPLRGASRRTATWTGSATWRPIWLSRWP